MTKLVKCATRSLKKRKLFALKHAVYAAHALFNGTIHFVQINFGGAGVNQSDYNTAITYSELAAPPISQYASQYGPNGVSIDHGLYTFSMPHSTYSDADLQSAVEQIASAQGFPNTDCIAVLNPQGATNTDAPLSQGVLGYHGSTGNHTYVFVNVEGQGLTVDDAAEIYADAMSHEIAEMVVDPAADLSNPETNDPCSGNCGVDYRNFYDTSKNWVGGSAFSGYLFFTNGVAKPASVQSCPAPVDACTYAPPGSSPSPTPTPTPTPTNPCVDEIKQGIAELESGQFFKGVDDIIGGIICLFEHGFIKKHDLIRAEKRLKNA